MDRIGLSNAEKSPKIGHVVAKITACEKHFGAAIVSNLRLQPLKNVVFYVTWFPNFFPFHRYLFHIMYIVCNILLWSVYIFYSIHLTPLQFGRLLITIFFPFSPTKLVY